MDMTRGVTTVLALSLMLSACATKQPAQTELSSVQSPMSPECRQTKDCKDSGECTYRDGKCAAASDAHCKQSKDCKVWGFCAADDGRCVAGSDANCRRSDFCKIYGWCHAGPDRVQCHATTPADCKQSTNCLNYGACRLVQEGMCQAN
jgi:hypothetical protein